MIKSLIAVGLGGFAGSVARYGVARMLGGVRFFSIPAGTLTVNLAGCFLLGLLTAALARTQTLQPEWRLLLTTGFCGGFTTYSTFMSENFALMRSGQALGIAVYLGASLVGGFALYVGGYLTGAKI